MNNYYIFLIRTITSAAIMSLFGCETDFQPKLEEADRTLVIDAWVTQELKKQEIRVYYSKPYFDNSHIELIPGATVKIEDLTTREIYSFQEGEDSYSWIPQNEVFGTVGNRYRLTVEVEGEIFEAISKMGRVPVIDTITFSYNKKDLIIKTDFYTAEFMAIDPQGTGDTYWVKTWKNNSYLGKPGELNMAYDAGFSSGQSVDGKPFILPIRKDFLNPYDKVEGKTNEFHPPYKIGDKVRVEIHSIDQPAYEFLYQLYFQINRPGGFAELFSIPLSNVPTNFVSTTQGSKTLVSGFFNVSAVSGFEQVLTEEIAEEARIKMN